MPTTPTPTPTQRFHAIIEDQAWTDSTVLGLVRDFVTEHPTQAAPLLAYLEQRSEPDEPPEPAPHESVDALEAQFGEIERDPNDDLFDFDAVKGTAREHVWTIVTGDDGSLWALAGVHYVNRLGYVLTPRPWLTGTEQFRFDA